MNLKTISYIFCMVLFISCGGSDDSSAPMTDDDMGQDPQNSANLIIDFSIPANDNNLIVMPDVQISGNDFKIFFPPNTNRTAIIANFQISEGAMLLINGNEIISGQTPINFNSTVTLKVIAESGAENNYTVTSEANFNTLDSAVQSLMGQYSAPGFQLAIVKNERLVYANSYGFADLQLQENVTDASVFRIASLSKTITLVGILKLIDDGILDMSTTVFGNNGVLQFDYGTPPYGPNIENITVQHLLDHTSGWTNNPFDPMFANLSWTQEQVINDMIDNRPLETTPGTQYYYSNFGYLVLGRIIEKVSGLDYDDYIKSILGSTDISTFEIAKNSINEKWPNEVEYFSQENFDPYTQMNVTRMDSHGGWVSNATDLARFLVVVDGNSNVPDILTTNSSTYSYLGFQEWWFFGSLPGTSTVFGHLGNDYHYVLLTNTRPSTNIIEILHDMQEMMVTHITSRNSWPRYDLF